jgi:hypothetical protein
MRRGIALGIAVGVALMMLSAYGSASGSGRIEALRSALPDCGWIMEEGERMQASCAKEAELAERMEAVRMERNGSRFLTDALALCAESNGAALSLDACLTYLAWIDATEECRMLPEQAEAEACLDRFPTN